MRISMIPAAIAAAALACSAPVAAQGWKLQPRVQREIQGDINQLDRQIARAIERKVVSQRDARDLRREAAELQRIFNRYSRNGLDRREVEHLEQQVNRLRLRLRLERRSWAGRR